MRECEVHPFLSRVIGVNKNNIVEVWDYTSHECIMSKPLHEILINVPIKTAVSTAATLSHHSQPLTTKQYHSLLQSHEESNEYPVNDFLLSRQRNSRHHTTVGGTFVSSPVITSALLSQKQIDDKSHFQMEKEISDRNHLNILQLQKVGYVKQATFVDREAIRWTCGVYSQMATKASKNPLYSQAQDSSDSEPSPFAAMSTTFHTPQRIMLVCESAVVFHDMQTNRSSAITILDFGATKAFPTCAEFIYPELCAIGCSDGCIRVWDCLQWKLVKTLNTSTKSAVQSLKNLLPKNHFSLTGQMCPMKDGHGRMRVLSTQADGVSLLWESEIYGNMILVGDDDPTGVLSTTGECCIVIT